MNENNKRKKNYRKNTLFHSDIIGINEKMFNRYIFTEKNAEWMITEIELEKPEIVGRRQNEKDLL